MNKYQTIIGLEIHASVITNSKVYSPSKNSFGDLPNDNVNEIDLSFPGILPSLNKEAVRKALKMSMVLGCKVPDELLFDRKNYYYPDLPKGYQITQVTKPIGTNGLVKLYENGHEFEVKIHDIHLEEDTASMDHYDYYSLIDYNRAGTPLIEMVTEPCLSSGEEVVAFLEFLVGSLRYCNISDADMKKGHLRCDVNINLKDENGVFITPRVEIKGISSIGYVVDAINYEVNRQIKAYETKCEELYQETRRFDEDTKTTIRMRIKENAVDYKYFVEPNIPRIKIDNKWLKEIKSEIPTLPNERIFKYIKEYGLLENDARGLVKDYNLSNYYDECVNIGINPKTAYNWLTTNIMGYLNKEFMDIKDFFITPNRLKVIIDKINSGKITSKQGKELFNYCLTDRDEPEKLIEKYNLKQMDNSNELEEIIDNILKSKPELIDDYHNGKTNLFGYFIGEVMKQTKGQANPVLAKQILTEKLQ